MEGSELTFLLPTFRDPSGSLEVLPEGAFRSLRPEAAGEVVALLGDSEYQELVRQGSVIGSEVAGDWVPGQTLRVRHPRVSFVSYPWEWPPALWLEAAELTLELCLRLLDRGWILKDATPLNVLFQGSRPIFVDVGSFQRLDPRTPLWFAYAQFVRTFLLPMVAYAQLGWPLSASLLRRDGYEPEELLGSLPWTRRVRRPVLTTVTLPALFARAAGGLGGRATEALSHPGSDAELNLETLRGTLLGLRLDMRRAMPKAKNSRWSGYVAAASHYSVEDHADKKEFVRERLAACGPVRVLDVGCNTGVYSVLAAEAGAEVVSIDSDLETVERLARSAREARLPILPLCVDFARPTPATGWENQETASFLGRCTGQFDTVLMLAVVHHLLLSHQIPMEHLASLCGRITTDHLIVEWVPPTDVRFVELVRGRDSLYRHIDERSFRLCFAEYFTVVRERTFLNGRVLLHLKRR